MEGWGICVCVCGYKELNEDEGNDGGRAVCVRDKEI